MILIMQMIIKSQKTMSFTKKDVNKLTFQKMLKKGCKLRFEYVKCGNDPCNSCGTVKREATYEFYAIIDETKVLLVYKNHRRTHWVVEDELTKKYSSWANKII